MLKNKRWVPLILALAVVLTLAGTLTSEAAGSKLVDIGEAPWAQQAIAEMNASDIISGYPGGMFKPYESATRLQVVAMLIRVIGLEEQAQALATTNVNYKLPSDLAAWGRGYLIVGVQQGMLDKDHLDQLGPNAPATRAQVAALTSLALKLSLDGGTLTFADTDQIPQDYRGYVSAVVKNKIMQGLPGNVFKPIDEINRAQMAVLLSKLVENNFAGDGIKARRIGGTLSTITPVDSSRWFLSLNSGTSKILTGDSEVFLDGKSAGPADLKVGDEINLVLNLSDQIALVKAARTGKTPSESGTGQTYKGQVSNLLNVGGEYWLGITDLNGNSLTRSVTGDIKVNGPGGQQEVSSLSKGKFVEIKVANNKIIEINALETSTMKGTVAIKRSTGLTVHKDTDVTTELDVSDNVVVTKDDSVASYDDLREGDLVEIEIYDNKAIKIDIVGSGNLEGVIRELDTSGTYGVTIRDDDGNTRDYVVDSDVEVKKDDSEIDFDELRTGERVRLELNSQDQVDYIDVLATDSSLEGVIRELDTSGTYGITISDDDGVTQDYVVGSDVEVWEDGSKIDFDELRTGEQVSLALNNQDQVDYIDVLDSESGVEGEIEDLDTSGTYGITIRDDDDHNRNYVVNSNVEVKKDGSDIDFDELRTGDQVSLELNSRDQVDYIVVIEDTSSTTTGEIADLVTGDNPRIRIEKSAGSRVQYTISDNTAFYKDGESIDLNDLVIGSEVEVRVANGKANRVEVTNDEDITFEGEVTYVNTGSSKIRIEQASGNEFTYYLKDNAYLKDQDGNSIDFEDVRVGWDVEMKLQGGKVYRLTRQ